MYAGTTNQRRAESIRTAEARPAPVTVPGLAVFVLNLNRPDLLLPLLDTLAQGPRVFGAVELAFEVYVGDTGSDDPDVLARYSAADPWLHVTRDMSYHFSRCNNELVATAAPLDRYLLLNNDVQLPSVQPLLDMAQLFDAQPRLGVLGLRLDFPDGAVQHAGIDFFRGGPESGLPYHPGGRRHRDHRIGRVLDEPAVTGACLMTRADLWWRLGGLDEDYEQECQDVDYCLAARRLGVDVKVLDAGPVVHLESATRDHGVHNLPDRRLLLRRWRSFMLSEFQ